MPGDGDLDGPANSLKLPLRFLHAEESHLGTGIQNFRVGQPAAQANPRLQTAFAGSLPVRSSRKVGIDLAPGRSPSSQGVRQLAQTEDLLHAQAARRLPPRRHSGPGPSLPGPIPPGQEQGFPGSILSGDQQEHGSRLGAAGQVVEALVGNVLIQVFVVLVEQERHALLYPLEVGDASSPGLLPELRVRRGAGPASSRRLAARHRWLKSLGRIAETKEKRVIHEGPLRR